MYRPFIVLSIIIVSLLLCFVDITKAGDDKSSQELPLVKLTNDDDIDQTGAYLPNGTLLVGEWADYYFNVDHVPDGYGIGMYL